MPSPTKKEALDFIKANDLFFRMPITDQEKFKSFYEDKDQIKLITDFSQKLITLLAKTLHEEGRYKAPALIWWEKGEFEKVLEHPEIRQFIIDNKDHPAITSWQKEYPPTVPKTTSKYVTEAEALEDCVRIKLLAESLKARVDNGRNEINAYLIELEQTPSSTENTAKNIQHLKKFLDETQKLKVVLFQLPWDLTINNIASAKYKLMDVQNQLVKTVRENLLTVHQEKYVKSFGEKLLNIVSNLLGFGEYKSKRELETEKGISNTAQSLPDALTNAAMKVKDKLGKLKSENNEKDAPKDDNNKPMMGG